MKSYLRLFLILVSFVFILNVAQAETPEDIELKIPEDIELETPEDIEQAHEAVWKVVIHKQVIGTAFFISPYHIVTNFHVISSGKGESYKSHSIEDITLQKGDQTLKLRGVSRVSAVDDLVILETEEEVTDYLELSKKKPLERLSVLEQDGFNINRKEVLLGRLFALGYPGGVKQTLIHLEKYGVIDDGYNYKIAVNKTNNKGSSGGAVLDATGKVIGVLRGSARNMADVVKVSQLEELRRGDIGLDCSKLTLRECIEQEIENLKEKAEEGYPLALDRLFRMYYDGEGGVEQDLRKASQLMLKLVEKGHPHILYQAALIYLEYRSRYNRNTSSLDQDKAQEVSFYLEIGGVNEEKVLDFLLKSVEQAYPPALVELAFLHFEGKGFLRKVFNWILLKQPTKKRDVRKAFELFSTAADMGYAQALYQLALMYSLGKGVRKDKEKSYKLMLEATKQGDADAQEALKRKEFQGYRRKEARSKPLEILNRLCREVFHQ